MIHPTPALLKSQRIVALYVVLSCGDVNDSTKLWFSHIQSSFPTSPLLLVFHFHFVAAFCAGFFRTHPFTSFPYYHLPFCLPGVCSTAHRARMHAYFLSVHLVSLKRPADNADILIGFYANLDVSSERRRKKYCKDRACRYVTFLETRFHHGPVTELFEMRSGGGGGDGDPCPMARPCSMLSAAVSCRLFGQSGEEMLC